MADFRVPSSVVGLVSGIARAFVLEVSRRRGAARPILCTAAIDPDLRRFCSAFNDAGFHGWAGAPRTATALEITTRAVCLQYEVEIWSVRQLGPTVATSDAPSRPAASLTALADPHRSY